MHNIAEPTFYFTFYHFFVLFLGFWGFFFCLFHFSIFPLLFINDDELLSENDLASASADLKSRPLRQKFSPAWHDDFQWKWSTQRPLLEKRATAVLCAMGALWKRIAWRNMR